MELTTIHMLGLPFTHTHTHTLFPQDFDQTVHSVFAVCQVTA